MSNKEVAEADEIVRRIKGKPTERELIENQEDLMGNEEPDDDDDEGYRPLPHTMDGHSSGSFVFTGVGFGIDKQRTTLTRFTEKRKPR